MRLCDWSDKRKSSHVLLLSKVEKFNCQSMRTS